MKSNENYILIPEYMEKFQCIGSACEDTCCSGWGVSVDKQSFKRYRSNKNPDLKDMLKKNITRNRKNQSDSNYAKIKMDDHGNCTFLNNNGLCKIQLSLGEDMLSNTCSTYPRIINKVNDIFEKSLTLSCPEAARLVLLNPKGIDFIEKENFEDFSSIHTHLNTQLKSVHFWELRVFTIQILQKKSFTIEMRLIILGLFFQKLSSIPVEDWSEKLSDLMATYMSRLNNKEYIESIERLPSNIPFQLELGKFLFNYRIEGGISSLRFKECLKDMIDGLNLVDNIDIKETTTNFLNSIEHYYSPFMDKKGYIMENYLVNYVFKNLFPSNEENIFDSFVMLVINTLLIKILLIGMANKHQGLTEELVVKLIQSYTKTVDHNASYLKNIQEMMKESGYSTIAHMTVLLKN